MMKMLIFNMFLIPMINLNKKMKFIFFNYIFLNTIIMLLNYNINSNLKIYYMYFIDNISFSLIILTIWIISLSFMANYNILTKKFFIYFFNLMLILFILLNLCFMSSNLIMFYIFFESSLIPIMLIIMGWGMQIDRIQASMYMLFYTLFGSLPLFFMLLYIYIKYYTLMMNMLLLINNIYFNSIFMYMMLITAFLIKLPMFLFHLWLPKAHVEAPIAGSMILAGIMLKLGSYGIMRMMFMFTYMFKNFNYLIMIISLMGSLISTLICLNQIDLKIIVAYSSIVHMGTLISSMMTLMNWGYIGSLMMMIAHGLCSSAMFCLVNFNYERIHSRNILLNKGLINLIPSISLWWFLICSSNFSAPPSLNLISELMLMNSLILWSKIIIIILMLIIFFSTCYCIFLYSYSQHGMKSKILFNFKFLNCREYLISILHWYPLNLMFLSLNLF